MVQRNTARHDKQESGGKVAITRAIGFLGTTESLIGCTTLLRLPSEASNLLCRSASPKKHAEQLNDLRAIDSSFFRALGLVIEERQR